MCNAVCNVGKFFRGGFIVIVKDGTRQNFAVQRGNAVHRMRCSNTKVCHTHLIVSDDGHSGNTIPVTRITRPKICAQPTVDLFHNHIYTRQTQTEQVHVPTFQRLWQHRVIGIAHGLCDNMPGIIPTIGIHIHQNAHQFRNNQCGMGIVDVQRDLLCKVGKSAVYRKMFLNDVLQGGRHEKILLCQTQKLSFLMVIRGIQHLGYHLGTGCFFHCVDILPLGKQFHIELRGILCPPQAQRRYRIAVLPGNQHIIRYGMNLFTIFIRDLAVAVVPRFVHLAAHAHTHRFVRARNQPIPAAGQPIIRQFHLVALDDTLLKKSIFIAQRKTRRSVILRC